MKDFKDKVAVITGAASGIGRSVAFNCVREGMNVVLADVEEKALRQTEEEIKAQGAKVLAVLTDVSKANDIKALAQNTLNTFGAVHLLFNNAGISVNTSRFIWKGTAADWQWALGVNMWGLIHGIQVFVPILLEQDTESHIVNTASMVGLMCVPQFGIYQVTKHGVIAISETLYHELALCSSKVKVSVLCPGAVNTKFLESDRNRPSELKNTSEFVKLNPANQMFEQVLRQGIQTGMSPARVADILFQGIRDEKFYIFTHPEMKHFVQTRLEDILQERNPTNTMPSN